MKTGQAFIDAWVAQDVDAATRVANETAIDMLFSHRPDPRGYVPDSCSGGVGNFLCYWVGPDPDNAIGLYVRNEPGLSKIVVSVLWYG